MGVFGDTPRPPHVFRSIHRDPHHDLQQMVLHDVANDAKRVKVAATPLQPKILLECDLHRLDVLAVPRGLKELIRPTERRDVEDDLLAQVVIQAIELRLMEAGGCLIIQLVERLRIAAEGLLDHQASEAWLRRARVFVDHSSHLCTSSNRGL
jgi:hypothetical protein